MPTVTELERLQALVTRLEPLTTKQRGELIEAEDWNLIVGALIEVARAALADDDEEGVAPHAHNDQVGIGWLDPRVRQLVTGGGVKDPGVETSLLKLRRDLGSLTERIDGVRTDVETSRQRLDKVAINDTVRESAITRLDRKVLGAADDRGDIADLRGTLRTLETEVARAVEVGSRLEINGEPLDVEGLVNRVVEVEALRERLTRPSGELLDATVFEQRVAELETNLVTEEELTAALEEVRTAAGQGGIDVDAVIDEARLAGREAATESVGTLGIELRSDLTRRLGEIGTTVDQAVAASIDQATGSLAEEVLASARADITAAIAESDDAIRSDLEGLLEERIAATTARVEERFATIPDVVGGSVAEQVGASLAEVTGRLDELQGGVEGLGRQVSANSESIQDVDTRLQRARREDGAARLALRNELTERITGLEGRLEPRLVTLVDEARSVLRTDLEATVAAARRDLQTSLDRTAREAAATEVQVLSTSVRTDVQSIVRQEIDATLAEVRDQITTEISGLQNRVAGMVSNEVARAARTIPTMVREEFDTFRPEIERIVDRRINRPPNR